METTTGDRAAWDRACQALAEQVGDEVWYRAKTGRVTADDWAQLMAGSARLIEAGGVRWPMSFLYHTARHFS